MSQSFRTKQNLVNIDHAREERRRRLSAEEREERGLPGPILAIGMLLGAFIAVGAFLYYGSALVLYGLVWLGVVLR